MSRLAAEVGAITCRRGFPDFDCDPALIDAVVGHMRRGQQPVRADAGRAAAAGSDRGEVRRRGGRQYDADTEVTVTSGATEAIFDAVAAVVRPGDEVIVLEPCYDSYAPAIELNGATPIFVPLQYPDYSSTGTRFGGRLRRGRG